MKSESIWLAVEIMSYIVASVMIILSIYCTQNLRSYHNEMFMKKRSLPISYGFIISFLITMISLSTGQYSLFNLSYTATIIPTVIAFASTWSYLYFLILKNWMIYYRYHFTYCTMESQWMQLINSNITSESNWFIKNNSRYGNVSFVCKVIAIPCIIGGIIFISCALAAVTFISQGNTIPFVIAVSGVAITLILPVLCYVIIVRKTPSHDDTFYIHWESKRHAKILLWVMNINTLTDIAMIVIDVRFIMVGFSIIFTLFFAIIYTSTIDIINKNTAGSLKEKNAATAKFNVTMKKVLSNQDAIHIFMTHLSKEFSMECVLSLIEIVQFKQYIKKRLNASSNDSEMKIDGKHVDDVIFPSTIAISEIIESEEEISNVMDTEHIDAYIAKIKAHKLYNKYIKVGSEFEINIEASQRQKLINILDDLPRLQSYNISTEDMYQLFDECKREMITLLTYSLARLKQTPEYANLELCFGV